MSESRRVLFLDGPMRGMEMNVHGGNTIVSFPIRRGPQPKWAAFDNEPVANSMHDDVTYEIDRYRCRNGDLIWVATVRP